MKFTMEPCGRALALRFECIKNSKPIFLILSTSHTACFTAPTAPALVHGLPARTSRFLSGCNTTNEFNKRHGKSISMQVNYALQSRGPLSKQPLRQSPETVLDAASSAKVSTSMGPAGLTPILAAVLAYQACAASNQPFCSHEIRCDLEVDVSGTGSFVDMVCKQRCVSVCQCPSHLLASALMRWKQGASWTLSCMAPV